MTCFKCGDELIGDGYTSALHCPNISEQQEQELAHREPDADILYCDLIVNNFEVNPFDSIVSDVAHEYGLSFPDAGILVSKLYVKSVEDLNSRFLCHASEYNFIGGEEYLEDDLYSVYGYVVPYDIVCDLIVARKPVEQL